MKKPENEPVVYQPIGRVVNRNRIEARPEILRRKQSVIFLVEELGPAIRNVHPGDALVVVFHLHRRRGWTGRNAGELFNRRTPDRPNPIGVTVVRVLETGEGSITVADLDAVNGTPILDIKPYKPIFDNPTPEGK